MPCRARRRPRARLANGRRVGGTDATHAGRRRRFSGGEADHAGGANGAVLAHERDGGVLPEPSHLRVREASEKPLMGAAVEIAAREALRALASLGGCCGSRHRVW
jgi:hypothetical protein